MLGQEADCDMCTEGEETPAQKKIQLISVRHTRPSCLEGWRFVASVIQILPGINLAGWTVGQPGASAFQGDQHGPASSTCPGNGSTSSAWKCRHGRSGNTRLDKHTPTHTCVPRSASTKGGGRAQSLRKSAQMCPCGHKPKPVNGQQEQHRRLVWSLRAS